MTLTLTVYRATPSLNEFANIRRSNAWKYRSLRTAWHYAISQALLEARAEVLAERLVLDRDEVDPHVVGGDGQPGAREFRARRPVGAPIPTPRTPVVPR